MRFFCIPFDGVKTFLEKRFDGAETFPEKKDRAGTFWNEKRILFPVHVPVNFDPPPLSIFFI